MAELYAKPFETIETGYNPQQAQGNGNQGELETYLSSLPPEERQAAIERINAPLSGEELALMASSGEKMPSIEEFAEIEKWHKTHEISFFDGLGKIAEGGEQVMTDLTKAFGAMFDNPSDVASKMPATAVEAFSQGTRNFYGMLAQSSNTDSVLFKVKDFLNGTGTIEDRYNQYIQALKFNKDSIELAEGKQTLVMDADMINHEVTQAMAYIADPTLFIPFGKVASTGLRAVGLGERLTMAGTRAAAIKNGIIGNTIKWGVGQPLEFLGGAVRNTIDYGLEKAGDAFEATTGMEAKQFAQTARMSGIGFSASAVAGHAVPYASTISDAYIVGSSAKGFGEALTLIGETMSKNKFGRGINSWAIEALEQAKKNGVALSPHAEGLLKAINAVDPLFAYGWNGLETAAEGSLIGGGLGYLSGGQEGMYSGIGAGIALGAVGGTAGKVVADITGGTNVARRAVQAKMVIEGHKVVNPEKAVFFQAMQKAAEARGQDVDLVNGIIAGIDNVAPNFEFHAMTPEQFAIEAVRKGYNPITGKFAELSAIDHEFGGDRASKSKAMGILRAVGGDFVGNSKDFLDALKKASAKDSANPKKPAGDIPANLRKYIDVAKAFDKLTKTQQDAILREIDGQANLAKELGGSTKLRDHYDALTWSEAWTDQLVKKFETDREGARKDIIDMLAQETKKDGKMTNKGKALVDKLRNEGFLDKEGKLLRERNLLQADMTMMEFASTKGGVVRREADGKTHMYINLNNMGSETFPHELFHTIMRESPMKDHFTKSLIQKLVGSFDAQGNLIRNGEVNVNQLRKFFKKYIDLTSFNEDGTLNSVKAEETMKAVEVALGEYEQSGKNKKISDKSRDLLEKYTEEFGAYYFSHWLMGRNRNTLFFGGELKGIEGLVERTKDSFMDFWQSKISKANPEFDFSNGLNEAFNRSKGLGRISSIDYYMRDMVRAASNANKDMFRPDSMSLENLRDFERSNGLRNFTTPEGSRRLNPREQVTQNIRLGKEAFKILSGLDKNLRTSKDTIDENGKPVITGRMSEAELDALVKGGIVPRAWADKVNQGYAMLDGIISNVFSAGYLGKTEQITDASYPRKTGKDVAFKNRKAILFDVETKIKADGTFYTLFHTLDLAVIEQRGNHLWQNVDYRNLWNGDRGAMEADFFRYISNASKASTDTKKLDSAALLEKGDGLGAQRRDVLQQMAGMALQTGDAYKHQPIAVIPEGIRHSVTTFNIDGLTTPRVEQGARYDIDMKNAHKFIRENWQPEDMKQENTPSGTLMTHASGFKFSYMNGKATAYTSAGRKIGTFDNIKSATNAAKNEYHKVYDNHQNDVQKEIAKQNENIKHFEALDENERQEAIKNGDLFSLERVKNFIKNRKVLRQTREEFIISKAQEALANPQLFEKAVDDTVSRHKGLLDEYTNVIIEINNANKEIVKIEDTRKQLSEKLSNATKERIASLGTNDYSIIDDIYSQLEATQFEVDKVRRTEEYLVDKKKRIKQDLYRQNISSFASQYARYAEGGIPFNRDTFIDGLKSTVKNNIAPMEGLANGGMQRTAYSSVQGTLFAHDFDAQFKTGEPIVVIGTHGTKNAELMISRILLDSKLGTRYGVAAGGKAYSSDLGHFMGGSTDTSSAYGMSVDPIFKRGTFNATQLSDLLGINSFNNATQEARYYKSSLKQYIAHVQEQISFKLDRVEAIAKKLANDTLLTQEQKSALNLEAIAILDFLQTRKYIDNEYKSETLKRRLTNIYSDASKYGNAKPYDLEFLKNDIEGIKKWTNVLEGIKINPDDIIKDRPSDEQIVHSLFAEEKEQAPFAVNDSISDPSEKIKFGDKEIDFPLSQQLYNNLINDTRQLMIVTNTASLNKIRTQAKLIKQGNNYVSGLNAKGFPSSMILLPKMQLRMMMAFDNPKVIIDPRGYDESTIAPQMLQAIKEGHDGVIFKRFADGGDMDDVYIQLKGGQDKILTIDSSFDPQHIPRKDEQGKTLKTGRDLKLSLEPDEPNAPKQIKGIQLDMTKAYNVFRQEYEESTGQSWSQDKFMQRARNWQFFGDENGFVAVRPQRSGFVKLVGMAGDNKSKLRGIQQIQQQGLPIWGMVSKEIKDMAVKRGMREPNMIERTVLKKALNSAALGDAEILGYTSDNGVRLRYPDIGEVVKYMIGSPEYYQKLRSDFGDQIKSKIGFQPDEGGRKYNKNEMDNHFIGRQAAERRDLTDGIRLAYRGWDKQDGKDEGRKLIILTRTADGAEIGRIDFDYEHLTKYGMKGRGFGDGDKDGIIVDGINVKVREAFQGKGYQHILYSEMFERARAIGATGFSQSIENKKGLPLKSVNRVIGEADNFIASLVETEPQKPTQENFDRLMAGAPSPTGNWMSNEPAVQNWGKIDKNAWYMPAEKKIPSRDEGFNRVYREISRNKQASTRSIKQSYLDKWGIDLGDYEKYQQLKEALYRLERDAEDGKDMPDFVSDRKDLKSEMSDLEDFMTGRIQEVQGEYAHQFTDQLDELERGISRIDTVVNQISKQPVKNIDIHQGDNRLEKVLFRELKSGYTQDISGMDIPIADAFREYAGIKYEKEMIGKAFQSELYYTETVTLPDEITGTRREEARKGILIDILKAENKIVGNGGAVGEVMPQRIINALRNKSGGDSKVYAEAKAIGLIDWLESKQEGNKQKKVKTEDLLDFVEENKMGLAIDPQLEQNADFGNTRPYVTGGEEQAGKGYRVYVVHMMNPKHKHGVEGHFGGAVVHVRATLRKSKDGKKVMHIEEIQANNTATDVLSESQRQIVTKEIQQLYKFKKEKDDALLYTQAESSALKSRFGEGTQDYATADVARVDRWQKKRDEISQKYAENLYDLNPEYWRDKFSSNTERDRDGYVKLVSKYLLSHNETILISEKETSLNNTKNNAPLQDPKEWVKVAFRTVLRKALVEGVDRITLTPWDETPIQVGMKAKSAQRFYGQTVTEAFNSELAKMNSVLSAEGKHESIPRDIYNKSKTATNDAIQKVATNFDAEYAQSNGADVKTIFKLLHADDADLATNHNRKALEVRMSYLLKGVPEDTTGKHELTVALQRKSNQFQDYLDIQDSIAGGKHPSGLEVRASAAGMSNSEYLVDRSLGFDLTPEMKKKAARPQRLMQPAEGWRDWKSERTSVGSVIRNAIGYVIMVQNDKFKVYSPAKALIGIYGNEDQAKRRVQKDEPKQ